MQTISLLKEISFFPKFDEAIKEVLEELESIRDFYAPKSTAKQIKHNCKINYIENVEVNVVELNPIPYERHE